MNNGNFLDSLLATNSVGPANKKSTWAQKTVTPTEGFQNTLEQLRPKIAAARPEPRTAQAASRDTPSLPDKKPVKRDLPSQAPDNTAGRVQHRQERSGSTHSESLTTTKTNKSTDIDSTIETEGQLATEVVAAEQPFDVQQVVQGSILSGMDILVEDSSESVIAEASPDEAALLAESGLIGMALNPALQDEAILPPALANQIAAALGAGGTGTTSPFSSTTANTLPTGLLNPDAMAEDIELALTQKGDAESVSVEGEVSDNPDLLLLNAKSILSKLTEANARSLDKVVLADDPSKALTAAPAIESLSRLSEAQSPAARAFVVQTGVPVTLGQPQWGQAVGERVLWLAAQNISSAEIRLDPPELGPMQVRVSVNQDQVNVSFTSPHPAVREVLDQQLNRLREMFSEQGLNLVDVDVSDKSFAQQDQEKDESNKTASSSQLEDEDLAPLASSIIVSNRLVDHYA